MLELRLGPKLETHVAVWAHLEVARDPRRISLELSHQVSRFELVPAPEPSVLPSGRMRGLFGFVDGPIPHRLFDVTGVRSVWDNLGKLASDEIAEDVLRKSHLI